MPVGLERKIGLTSKRHVFVVLVLMSVLDVLFLSGSFRSAYVSNVSAVSVAGNAIGVYWDQAATNSCVSISWRTLAPGESRAFVLYVRNEASQSLYYLLTADRWSPVVASQYLALRWSYNGSAMGVGSVLRVLLTLSVSHLIGGVTDFSFDVVILASHYLFGDVNSDGRVDIRDMTAIAKVFGLSSTSVGWNPNADVNGDGRVGVVDLAVAAKSFGKSI